ncbi:hypothetical protein AZKH_0373 [Azoarcus sp. KH32C]|nr:hypothetical protein AZKH_0373 [Azoarcus sp. KH32C]
MRSPNVFCNPTRPAAAQQCSQIVPVIRETADDEIVELSRVAGTHIADHLARQDGTVRVNHCEAAPRKTVAAGPRLLRRFDDGEHGAVEQSEDLRQSGRRAVCLGKAGSEAIVRGIVDALQRRIRRFSAQTRHLELIESEPFQVGNDSRHGCSIFGGGRNACMDAQLRQPLPRLTQQAQGLLDFREETRHPAEAVVVNADAIHRQGHHDAPEGRDLRQSHKQRLQLLRVGTVRRHADRAHARPVVGGDDFWQVVAQQRLAAGERQVAEHTGALREALDARQVEFGGATDRLALWIVEAVPAVGVAAVGQELDQVAGRAARQQAPEVSQHDRYVDEPTADAARRHVFQRQSSPEDDRCAGRDMEGQPGRHEQQALAACEIPEKAARHPRRQPERKCAERSEPRQRDRGDEQAHAENQRTSAKPLGCAPHHRVEDAVVPDELHVVARPRHQFAHVGQETGLAVLDTQRAGKPSPVSGRVQTASQLGILEHDLGVLAESAEAQEDCASYAAHRSAQDSGSGPIESVRAHRRLAHVQVAREGAAAGIAVVIAARNRVVFRMSLEDGDALAQEIRVAKPRVGIEKKKEIALGRARASVAGRSRTAAVGMMQHAEPRMRSKELRCPVAGAIVDGDEFAARDPVESLRSQGFEQTAHHRRAVMYRDDYREPHTIADCIDSYGFQGFRPVFYAPAAPFPSRP